MEASGGQTPARAARASARRRRANGEGTVYRRRDGYWGAALVVGYGADGRPIRRTRCATTQRGAVEKLAALRSESLAGATASPAGTRLAEYLGGWLKNSVQPSVSASTYRSYEGYVRNHIGPVVGGVRLAKLSPTHVQALQAELGRKGASPTVRLHAHVVLRRALGQALRFGLIARNPCDVVPRPKIPRRQPKWFDADQVRILLEAARGDRLEALAVLAVTTGLREGELLGLQWGDIDLSAATLAVSRQLLEGADGVLATGELKTARSRRLVELPALAVEALRRHRARLGALPLPAAPLFTGPEGGPIRRSNLLRRWFYPLLVRAGLPKVRFHDLRHTHASLLLAQGVNPKVVQERLGHSQISITLDTYSHVLPTLQRDAARRLDELLGCA